jgi:murein DD-endopeptidase MepM/ murein hydrolase activator NlpD
MKRHAPSPMAAALGLVILSTTLWPPAHGLADTVSQANQQSVTLHSDSGDAISVIAESVSDFKLTFDVDVHHREGAVYFRLSDDTHSDLFGAIKHGSRGYGLVFCPFADQGADPGIRFSKRCLTGDLIADTEWPPLAESKVGFPRSSGKTRLTLEVKGQDFKVFENGAEILSAHDPSYTSGRLVWRVYGRDGLPGEAEFRLVELTIASAGFDYPVGGVNHEGYGVEAGGGLKFLEPWDYQRDGQPEYHPGEDWNAVDGNDAGQPVYAASQGTVVDVIRKGDPRYTVGWGCLVLIRHDSWGTPFRLPEGGTCATVWSQYGHLASVSEGIEKGAIVARRQQIGTIGDYPAGSGSNFHLHFEIRRTDREINAFVMNQPESFVKANYIEPRAFVDANRPNTNIALHKPVSVTVVGNTSAEEARDASYEGWGESPEDITDGRLDFRSAPDRQEDGCVGWVNSRYNRPMTVKVTIDLQRTYRINGIRYNMGDAQRAETWNADTMRSPFGETRTNAGSPHQGAWTEQTGDATLSKVEIVFTKTRRSYETDWLFIGEIEVYGTPVAR